MIPRRKRTDLEKLSKAIEGKGWSVGRLSERRQNHVYPYAAIVIDGRKTVSVGQRATHREAAILAVAAARHYGTLDCAQTVRWFKTMGYRLDWSETLHYEHPKRSKGWCVLRRRTKAGTDMYIGYVGHSRQTGLRTVCSRKNKRVAVEYAIRAAIGTDHYDAAASVLWLERNGMGDLARLATTAKPMTNGRAVA